jgi:hypothetical protein
VTYTAYSDSACTVLVFTSASIPLGTSSGPFTPSTAGTYLWTASYSGDANNNAAATACGTVGELLFVLKASPTLTTTIQSVTGAPVTSIALGSSAVDQATLSGGYPASGVTGTVTYTFFPNGACLGEGALEGTVTVGAGNSVGPSNVVTPSTGGTYSFNTVYSGDVSNGPATNACEQLSVTSATQPILLTFRGFDLDDYDNGIGQFQVFVNGHLVVDIPAGLHNLSGSGDYAPYTDRWVSFGPFDITSFVVNGQNIVTFRDLDPADHYGLVRDVRIVQGATVLLNVGKAVGIYPGHSRTYTFSIPPLVIASFAASTLTPVRDENVTFTATFTGGTAPFKCIFQFGDGENAIVAASNGTCSTVHDYDYRGTFVARVTVEGSSTSDSVSAHLSTTASFKSSDSSQFARSNMNDVD